MSHYLHITRRWVLFALIANSQVAAAAVHLTREHTDIRITYDPLAQPPLDIVLRYNNAAGNFVTSSRGAFLVGTTNSQRAVPSSSAFAFLGPVGSPVWILPQTQDSARLFLGVSTETIPTGVFNGSLELQLRRVEGPGNFYVWQTPGPVIRYLHTNGVIPSGHRSISLPAGFHDHFNWGFGSTGLYHVTFQPVGRRIGETTNLVGREVTVAFQILPLRPYEQWITTNWPPAEPRHVVHHTADPDGDTSANLWEYIGGTGPADPASIPPNPRLVIVESGGQRFAELRLVRRPGGTDTTVRLAVAESASGPYLPVDVPVVVLQSDADTESIALPAISEGGLGGRWKR